MRFFRRVLFSLCFLASPVWSSIDFGECLLNGECEGKIFSYKDNYFIPEFTEASCSNKFIESKFDVCDDSTRAKFVQTPQGLELYGHVGGKKSGSDYFIFYGNRIPYGWRLRVSEHYTPEAGAEEKSVHFTQALGHRVLKVMAGVNQPHGRYRYDFQACQTEGCLCKDLLGGSVIANVNSSGVSFTGGDIDELFDAPGFITASRDLDLSKAKNQRVYRDRRVIEAPAVTRLYPPSTVMNRTEALRRVAFLAAPYGNNFGDICEGLPTAEQQDCNICINNASNNVDELRCVIPKALNEELRNNNVTLAITAFDGINRIDEKSQAYQKTIKHIQAIRDRIIPKSQQRPFVMLGLSMGGVIARDALVELEKQGHDHEVKWYVSIDSPHRGAYVPIGFQQTLKFITDAANSAKRDLKNEFIRLFDPAHDLLVDARKQFGKESANSQALYDQYFDTETSKEILLEHINHPTESGNSIKSRIVNSALSLAMDHLHPPNQDHRQNHVLFDRLQNRMANKMPQCTDRNIAIVNGAINGRAFPAPNDYFHLNAVLNTGNARKDPSLILVVRNPVANTENFYGRLRYVDGKKWNLDNDWKNYQYARHWDDTGVAYDEMPCSTTSIAEIIRAEIEPKIKPGPFTLQPMNSNRMPENCFIPTFSAVGMMPDFYGNGNNNNDPRYLSVIQNQTIFDRTSDWIIGGNQNLSHFSFDNIAPIFGKGTDINGRATTNMFTEVYADGGLANGASQSSQCK